MTGIHVRAYGGSGASWACRRGDVRVGDLTQQLADVDDDVMDLLGATCGSWAPLAAGYRRRAGGGGRLLLVPRRVGRGAPDAGRRRALLRLVRGAARGRGGRCDHRRVPMARSTRPRPVRWHGRGGGQIAEVEGRAVFVGSICGGLSEGLFKMRGFEDGHMDLAAEPERARQVMERILEIKLAYWDRALRELGDLVDVVGEADDLGGQDRPLFSPATYRSLVKPLQRELFSFIRARTSAKVFLHSCGAIRELVPDLIEIGVDILNPVQVSATGMDGAELKREFGRDLDVLGRRRRHAARAGRRHAGRGPRRGPAARGRPARRRRVRVRGRPQHPAQRARREHPRHVGRAQGGQRCVRSSRDGWCSRTTWYLVAWSSRTAGSRTW